MKTKIFALIIAALAAFLITSAAFAEQMSSMSSDGSFYSEYKKISNLGSTLVIEGDAYLRLIDKATNTTFEAYGSVIKITPFSSKANSKPGAMGSIKSIEIVGPVKVVRTEVDSGEKTCMTVISDSATYDGATELASFVGNVKMTSDAPDMSSVTTGDKAVVSTKLNPGPNDFRFSVENINGKGRTEAATKPQNKDAGK